MRLVAASDGVAAAGLVGRPLETRRPEGSPQAVPEVVARAGTLKTTAGRSAANYGLGRGAIPDAAPAPE